MPSHRHEFVHAVSVQNDLQMLRTQNKLSDFVFHEIEKGNGDGVHDPGAKHGRREILPEEHGQENDDDRMKGNRRRHPDKDTDGHTHGDLPRVPLEADELNVKLPQLVLHKSGPRINAKLGGHKDI